MKNRGMIIKMNKKGERNRRRRITERRVKLAAFFGLLFAIFMTWGGYVYGKYYAQSYQNGIAIASGVYFTANYAVEVESETEAFIESVVNTTYQGKDFNFEFEVRNYENNLLFNESTVVIPYSVMFWLEEAPEGATYTVEYNGETKTLSAGEPAEATFSMHGIAGGSAMANVYTISADVADDAEHEPIPVYVEVKTEASSVINSTLKGKMVFTKSQKAENYIESQQFVVSKEVNSDDEKFAEIKNMSGLTYEIRTVGEVSGDSGVTEKIKLSWDSTVLEIDLFDDAYLEWKTSEGATAPLEEEKNGVKWHYILIDIMPYSAETISFFRGTTFDNEEKVNSMDTLHSFIEAEIYQSNGG